jgi:hypothetical protein
MKTLKMNAFTKRFLLGILTLMLLFSVESQAKKYKFLTSSVVPAARGFAKITRDNNRNYVIKMKISSLAEVQRLDPSKLSYVVWMVTDREIIKNIGQIESSSAFMSKELKASFETVSSFTPIQIYITTEDDASVQYPGSQVVLTTNRFTN